MTVPAHTIHVLIYDTHVGYVIGLIIEACIAHQKLYSPSVADPVHVTAHFLRPVQAAVTIQDSESNRPKKQSAPFEVLVKLVKGGSSTNNLQAELIQNASLPVRYSTVEFPH